MQYIENKTFDEINVGDTAEVVRTLTSRDIDLFSAASGNANPSLILSVLETDLPGPGTIYVTQRLSFLRPVAIEDCVTVSVVVTGKDAKNGQVTLDCRGTDQNGEIVIEGRVEALASTQKIRRPRIVSTERPQRDPDARYNELIAATQTLDPVRTAVVHPCDALSLGGALEAAHAGLIEPVLIGPRLKIEAVSHEIGSHLEGVEIVDVPHSHAAAEAAVALAREGKVDVLMKGKLHTDELLAPVMDRTTGLRTEGRISHVFALDVPYYPKPLFVTDAAINIFPNLETKRDIVQNAINLLLALGVSRPKVAILSAVETVYPKIPSTIDAAALCKMADRGQITGGDLEGPLALDNAVSKSAAEAKGITSEVAGDADVLVVPDLEAGNMIAKQLIHLAGAESAGLVLGARIPIVLTSRADGVRSRLASAAMAQILHHHDPKG